MERACHWCQHNDTVSLAASDDRLPREPRLRAEQLHQLSQSHDVLATCLQRCVHDLQQALFLLPHEIAGQHHKGAFWIGHARRARIGDEVGDDPHQLSYLSKQDQTNDTRRGGYRGTAHIR